MHSIVPHRFWAKVDRRSEDECWPWTAYINNNGYGAYHPRVDVKVLAHRVAYELTLGPVPEGLDLDHLCRNRACANPRHLEPVTRQVNLLRGQTLVAANAAKTMCPQGHPYAGDNLIVSGPGRKCRTCKNERRRKKVA